jgi:dephospho-CoA kinase
LKVIGVVGLNGSGKDEVVNYLNRQYGVPLISVGDIVREIAAKEAIEPTRDNLDSITKRYFNQFGEGYFVKKVVEKIRISSWKAAGISGIRSPKDVSIVKEAFKQDFVLTHVYISDPKVRYERISKRGSKRDQSTYEEFITQDNIGQELFHIQDAIKLADYSIANNGTLEEMHKAIDSLIKKDNWLK